jgi:hypothetical protein
VLLEPPFRQQSQLLLAMGLGMRPLTVGALSLLLLLLQAPCLLGPA